MEVQVIEFLRSEGVLSSASLERVGQLQEAGRTVSRIELLLRLGLLSEVSLASAWSSVLDLPLLRADALPEPLEVLAEVPVRFLKHHAVIPIGFEEAYVHLWLADPADRYPVEALEYALQRSARLFIGVRSEIEQAIERCYGEGRSAVGSLVEGFDRQDMREDDVEHLKDLASEAPVIRLVNLLLQRAIERRASDIHIEPFESLLKVRYRVDGLLLEAESLPASSAAAVISRIKIMARLDIAERRLPQDGRIMLRIQGKELDLRVSTVPTSFGESVVMRLLDRQAVMLDLVGLGLDGERLNGLVTLLESPNGILLVTGPTGSGKTTTLYAGLSRLNTEARKIITVEDPVEYQLQGINQIQVKPAIGLDFANALRSVVRQDPDVIMIGEMRDPETCRIAIQASLTGHLVLSTLHTNGALATITRLLDMGVERYLIASTVNGILAQRLVRRLDPECREAFEVPAELVAEHDLGRYTHERPIRLYRARNTELGNGYRGRSAITELLVMDDRLRGLLLQNVSAVELEQAAREAGFRTLYEDGLRQALAGITTLDEVLRVTRGEQTGLL
ncbi:type II secretion system ATPase GspE [Phytopseudomonas daroniae]|uniref:type II secretion system ATPase GspE n=1 Tax=Phytopseudomonas daroniae TaxID=2487519 RepID=UPI003CC5F647